LVNNLNNFLFIGDSFTERLSDTIKLNNDKVYVCALGGTTPGYWIDRVKNMPKDVEAVVLLIGTNGIIISKFKQTYKLIITISQNKLVIINLYIKKSRIYFCIFLYSKYFNIKNSFIIKN